MKLIKNIGLVIFLVGLSVFTSLSFLGEFNVSKESITKGLKNAYLNEQQIAVFVPKFEENIVNKGLSGIALSTEIVTVFNQVNEQLKKEEKWNEVVWKKPQDVSYEVTKIAMTGLVIDYQKLLFFLSFGLGIIGSLMFILPNVILLGPAGIKNDHIYQESATNRGWIGFIVFGYLVTFYIILYFYPAFLTNQILTVDFVKKALNGGEASQWFLYGFIYCVVMTVMSVRMFIKYRDNKYQILRTSSVLFFQIAFAFLIPEIMSKFQMPWYDFKNAWPLNYTFFFDWNINSLLASGNVGLFMLVWGIVLSLIIVPLFVYLYGKRWYCSWVCGCGGLAETLGDPYRQLSDKSINAWKVERWLIHGVLAFAILMTLATIYSFFTEQREIVGIQTADIQSWYGFLIGSIFSGVIGTGFYPVFGNRVWCRMGCPLAAYMGLIQRFKSRFRITTNGGQCISCGNCSTYCEQGIDVRAYAQKGQNIVRSSCVGCGVCSAVCPRGVLKLENGPEEGRINDNPIIIGKDSIELTKLPEIK